MLFEAEDNYSQACLKYKGYLALSDAFKCFFLETIELVNTEMRPKITAPLSEHYALFVPRLTHSFKSVCGSERLALKGYPLEAYTLLRNVFDTLVLVSAAIQKITDFYSIVGVDPSKTFNPKQSKKLRKNTSYEACKHMLGDKSGLSQSTIDQLAKWDDLFDMEVHGALLSLGTAKGWMKGESHLPVLPEYLEITFAMFMNRYCEVAWLIHRLLPLMQVPDGQLNDSWKKKWVILDESFESIIESLTTELNKKIGAAIVEFVKKKYPFTENTSFPL